MQKVSIFNYVFNIVIISFKFKILFHSNLIGSFHISLSILLRYQVNKKFNVESDLPFQFSFTILKNNYLNKTITFCSSKIPFD